MLLAPRWCQLWYPHIPPAHDAQGTMLTMGLPINISKSKCNIRNQSACSMHIKRASLRKREQNRNTSCLRGRLHTVTQVIAESSCCKRIFLRCKNSVACSNIRKVKAGVAYSPTVKLTLWSGPEVVQRCAEYQKWLSCRPYEPWLSIQHPRQALVWLDGHFKAKLHPRWAQQKHILTAQDRAFDSWVLWIRWSRRITFHPTRS